jgi:hypothetical protein
MMDRSKAAQYFIVAWVKDWSLLTYLQVLGDGGPRIRFSEAQQFYPWLPGIRPFIKNHLVRTHLAESNRPLSDALWNAPDNRARLALAPQVEAFVFTRRMAGYISEARRETFAALRVADKTRLLIEADVEDQRRNAGHHWKVCK